MNEKKKKTILLVTGIVVVLLIAAIIVASICSKKKNVTSIGSETSATETVGQSTTGKVISSNKASSANEGTTSGTKFSGISPSQKNTVPVTFASTEPKKPTQTSKLTSATQKTTQSTTQKTTQKATQPSMSATSAISHSSFTQHSFLTGEGITLKYWLYAPSNPMSNQPLMVYLHGGSGKGDDLNLVVGGSFPKFLKDGELGDVNAYVLIPQLPSNKKGWSDIKVALKDLIADVSNTYKVNKSKISLTGHSMGGKGTYDIALAYPDLFSCIAPMSGSVQTNDSTLNALRQLPVWAFVGSADKIVDPQSSMTFINSLKKINPSARLTTFDGADHFSVPELGYKTTDVLTWLISNTK